MISQPQALAALRISDDQPDWPFLVVNAIKELCSLVLMPEHAESLERLQLLSLTVHVFEHQKSYDALQHKQCAKIAKDRLRLSCDMVARQQRFLHLDIDYFMRGQRKFMMQTVPFGFADQKALQKFTSDDVSAFFTALSQDNNFLSDKELFLLNGKMPTMPSHMVFALLMLHTLNLSPIKNVHLRMNFYAAVPMEKELILAYNDTATPMIAGLFADDVCLASVEIIDAAAA